jgi:prepilin-type N-terminal cleavage/methylation domain-containing protein
MRTIPENFNSLPQRRKERKEKPGICSLNSLCALCAFAVDSWSSLRSEFTRRGGRLCGEMNSFSLRSSRLRGGNDFGFTLVELMLALFIGLLLLVGVNAIFTGASQSIQAGLALDEATRNSQAAAPILYNDLHECAADSPAFIITSAVVPQYLNAADAAASNASPGAIPATSGFLPWDHLHRCDQLMFFARGLFKRKTSNHFNTGTTAYDYLVSTTTSDEAYIHYGHLRTLASDGVTYVAPDDNMGTSEPYAANWVLGRNVILMADPFLLNSNAKDPGGNPEWFYPATNTYLGGQWKINSTNGIYPGGVAPFAYNSYSDNTVAPNLPYSYIQSSRYDLAGATIDEFRSNVTAAGAAQAQQPASEKPYVFWWAPLIYEQPYANGLNSTWPLPYPSTPLFSATLANPTATPFYRNRFQGSSVLSPTPESGADQAGLAPFFLQHVSQFVVEYAGDFVTQDSTSGNVATMGSVTDTVPDGQIDWLYATKGVFSSSLSYSAGDWVIYNGLYYEALQNIPTGSGVPSAGATWATGFPPRTIRWYGMYRDSIGNGQVFNYGYTNGAVTYNNNNLLTGVVPLVDVWQTSSNNANRPVPYEVEEPLPTSGLAASPANTTNYATTTSTSPVNYPTSARYTAVWRNDVPAMVRILIKVDDPNNAIKDGPWYEYVFKLK